MDINEYIKFSKAERSTFTYWFEHWRAFNNLAQELGVWKFKYLFHDMEKPWLKLLMRDYKKVQKFHRLHNRHHIEYKGEKDWEALVIDWECSRYTKIDEPRTALEEATTKYESGDITLDEYSKIVFVVKKLGLKK